MINFSHFLIIYIALFGSSRAFAQNTDVAFIWPEGKEFALSLSFDDGRASQVEVGMPLLNRHDVKATFYVMPDPVTWHLEQWKQVVANGHEIGNHTINHPCTSNFDWVQDNATENYTLEKMRGELLEANKKIHDLVGVVPVTFAYSCGETSVGRGTKNKSYIPLVAELFVSGRGWLGEAANNPNKVDLAHVLGIKMDDTDFAEILTILEKSHKKGYWVVLAGHEIGNEGEYTTRVEMLEKLIHYAQDPENKIWLAPVGTISKYIAQQRNIPK